MPLIDVLNSQISDNYFYLIRDPDSARAALIDPIDAQQAIEHLQREELSLELLITTHFHYDHSGGNAQVLEAFPDAQLLGGHQDAEKIAKQSERTLDRTLRQGDTVTLGSLQMQVLDTPGHTPGHISLLLEHQGQSHLLSGDTIFVAGAGNCSFGGDAPTLFSTFRQTIAPLDDMTHFYPGHDYAIRDLEFTLSIQPDNEDARLSLERWRKRSDGSLQLTTLGEERLHNLFMRTDQPALQDQLARQQATIFTEQLELADGDREQAAFCTLRQLRNNW